MSLSSKRLRIALQKSGRLSAESHDLLRQCGVRLNLQPDRLLACAENLPIDILRVRDDDIPGLVFDGVVDWGILGENVLEEAANWSIRSTMTSNSRCLRNSSSSLRLTR